MPADRADDRPSNRDESGEHRLGRVGRFLRLFSYLLGLPVITLLGSLLVGYFQYWNAYQEKVANQAKEDLKLATETFEGISTAFSDAQALQNQMFSNFASAIRGKSDASATALSTRNALEASKAYEKAQTDLHKKIALLSQKAQIYVDWASDFDRDPSQARNVDDDPLSLTLLRSYRFDCSDRVNFPEFGDAGAAPRKPSDVPDDKFCASERKQDINHSAPQSDAFIRICPGPKGVARRIYWFSAKHHILTMQYCFDAMHSQLEPVRQWASQSDRDAAKESEIFAQRDQIAAALADLEGRLKSFNSLALYQMERIRVKYRPVGFECFIPGLSSYYAQNCLPLRTTTTAKPPPPPPRTP